MPKDKKMPKEYALVVSLIIFFVVIIIVGTIRVINITRYNSVKVDLSSLAVIEQDTSINYNMYNIGIVNALREKYSVDVYYGDNINVQSVDAVGISKDKDIFNMLLNISNTLSMYPDSLIKEIEEKGYTVSIYLVDHFNTNMEALANRNSIGQFKIYMSKNTNIERALHHEFYHILDYYIKLEKEDKAKLYEDWENINPQGFVYTEDVDNITGKYVYEGKSGAYFVTAYAKYSEKEDRAETFAEMVTADRQELFFENGEPISSKMNILKKVLINSFESINISTKIVSD